MTVDLRLALQEERAGELADRVQRLVGPFTGTELALDSGCGAGALAFALAPYVGEVVGVDSRADYLDAARSIAPDNVRFVDGEAPELPGSRVFLADQLGSVDPLRSLEQDRFERLRDPTHERLLSEADIRGLLDANDLVLETSEVSQEEVDLEQRLELAGVPEDERVRIRGLAPGAVYEVEVGWYVARKPGV